MREAPRVVLHIGMAKTGTTQIQNTFNMNRDILRSMGLTYGLDLANHSRTITTIFSKRALRYPSVIGSGIDRSNIDDHKKRLIEDLRTEIQGCDTPTYMLSGESSIALGASEISDVKLFLSDIGVHDVDIVCYVREPASFATSLAQQRIKTGATLDNVRKNPPLPKFRERLGPWVETFGLENIRFNVFEDAVRLPGGPVQAMLDTIGIGGDNWTSLKLDTQRNSSLCMEAAILADAVNKKIPFIKKGKISKNRSRQDINTLLRDIKGTKFHLGKSAVESMREDSADDVVWLEKCMGRSQIFPQRQAEDFPEPEWSHDVIEAIGVKLFSMHSQIKKMKR